MTPDYDKYEELYNSVKTYNAIAWMLAKTNSCIIGWMDGDGSHHDILFTLEPYQMGRLHGGMRGPDNLFVSVLRIGCFGFDIVRARGMHPSYIAEKLNLSLTSSTTKSITDLINGVLAALLVWRETPEMPEDAAGQPPA